MKSESLEFLERIMNLYTSAEIKCCGSFYEIQCDNINECYKCAIGVECDEIFTLYTPHFNITDLSYFREKYPEKFI